jgi:type II secretory pathway component PulF
MTRYRYEATDRSGIPIHGTTDADSESDLVRQMTARGLRLISSSELSLNSLIDGNVTPLPRLYQLRVGEQLREALMTELPAHEAIRAIAAEPLSHPLLGIAPWFQSIAVSMFIAAFGLQQLSGGFQAAVGGMAALAFIIAPMVWLILHILYQRRPRRLLRILADRLESGESVPALLRAAMPTEARCVMTSEMDDDSKARVAAELLPNLLGRDFRGQQFVITLLGPLIMLAVVIVAIHSTILLVVPGFKSIFQDFGVQLPVITEFVISVTDIVVWCGFTGWAVVVGFLITGLILTAVSLSAGRVGEVLESVPLLGMAFRWAMQARVARVLAATVRCEVPYGESLRTATAGSGFVSVQKRGKLLAHELESGSGNMLPTGKLSGLPLSLLFSNEDGVNANQRRTAVADTFQSLSEMLDSATIGQGRLLSILLQMLTVFLAGLIIATGLLAMFLPLIKLLNDLS